LDKKDEEGTLFLEEAEARGHLLAEFWKLSTINESILYQKSRSKWLKQGDMNTTFFHALINRRNRVNAINRIWKDNSWVDDPRQVKSVIKDTFERRFIEDTWARPTLDGVPFNSLSNE